MYVALDECIIFTTLLYCPFYGIEGSLMEDQKNVYEEEAPQNLIGEIFSGKLTLEQALQRLRIRLLDLTSQNRLLNYRHPEGRCIQFIDSPNINPAIVFLLAF